MVYVMVDSHTLERVAGGENGLGVLGKRETLNVKIQSKEFNNFCLSLWWLYFCMIYL